MKRLILQCVASISESNWFLRTFQWFLCILYQHNPTINNLIACLKFIFMFGPDLLLVKVILHHWCKMPWFHGLGLLMSLLYIMTSFRYLKREHFYISLIQCRIWSYFLRENCFKLQNLSAYKQSHSTKTITCGMDVI